MTSRLKNTCKIIDFKLQQFGLFATSKILCTKISSEELVFRTFQFSPDLWMSKKGPARECYTK